MASETDVTRGFDRRTRRARSLWGWIAVLVTLGVPMMIMTIAVGSIEGGLSSSLIPWYYAIILGIPLVIGGLSYLAMRRTGRSRLKAVAGAVAIPVAMLVGVTAVFWLLIWLA